MSDELKQNEKTETLSNFTEITCRQYLNLQGKILRLFKSLCLFASTWTDITLSWLHIGFFEDYTGKSSRTVTRCIKELYDGGYVDILKSGTSNVYIINQAIAWTSYGNQKQYCKFNGNILISASENKDYYYRHHSAKIKALKNASAMLNRIERRT